MICIPLLACFFIVQIEEPPYKPKEDFEVKLELSFRQRTNTDETKMIKFNQQENEKRPAEGILPTLKLHVKILNVQAEETKLKVLKDDAVIVLSKKVEQGMEFKIDLGFTDDLKDQVEGYKHVIQFFSPQKKIISKIVIQFDQDGNYYVNGEKLGKV